MSTPQNSTNRYKTTLKYVFSFISHNFWVKTLSLFFAAALFFIVRTEQNRTFVKVAHLKIIPPNNLTVVGSAERSIDVTFTLQNSLFTSPPSDAELMGEIDLSNKSPGLLHYPVTRENFPKLDKKYNVIFERPFLDIELDFIQTRNIPIKVLTEGEPEDGLSVEKVLVIPPSIKVTGGRKYINNLEYLTTQPVNIQNIDKNYSTIAVLAIDKAMPLTLSQDKITAEIRLAPKKFNRTFHAVPIEVRGLARHLMQKLEMRPKYVDIEIQAPKNILNTINPSDIHAFIDGAHLDFGWQDKKVNIKIPPQTNLVQIVPNSISVNLAP